MTLKRLLPENSQAAKGSIASVMIRLSLFFLILIIGQIILSHNPAHAAKSKGRHHFYKAESCFNDLIKNPRLKKDRDRWLVCIAKFEKIHTNFPSDPYAAAALFQRARIFRELYRFSGQSADLREAHRLFKLLIKRYPRSQYQKKSLLQLKKISLKKITRVPAPFTYHLKETISESSLEAGPALVTGLRYWSNPSYTRVVIDAQSETVFNYHLLKQDPVISKPPRLYIDLHNAKLASDLPKTILIDDNLLMDTRAGQYTSDSVRVVIDIKSFKTFKIFSLRDPFRIVIDVQGKSATGSPPGGAAGQIPGKGQKLSKGTLAKQFALGVGRIVIDPGHGGHDSGARGYYKGVYEKQVVLGIARKLARKIRSELGLEVIMTRDTDRFISLEERTAIANTKNADLFISIHTNASFYLTILFQFL